MEYLGVNSQINKDKESQTIELCIIVNSTNQALSSTHTNQYYTYIYQQCSISTKTTHPLVASLMNDEQISTIQNKLQLEVSANKNFNINWPKVLRYKWHKYNRLELLDYRVG